MWGKGDDKWTMREVFVLRLFLLIVLVLKLVSLVVGEISEFRAMLLQLSGL